MEAPNEPSGYNFFFQGMNSPLSTTSNFRTEYRVAPQRFGNFSARIDRCGKRGTPATTLDRTGGRHGPERDIGPNLRKSNSILWRATRIVTARRMVDDLARDGLDTTNARRPLRTYWKRSGDAMIVAG